MYSNYGKTYYVTFRYNVFFILTFLKYFILYIHLILILKLLIQISNLPMQNNLIIILKGINVVYYKYYEFGINS